MLRTIILNALFIVAEYISSNVDALVYRLAIVAIVVLIHTLWFRMIMRRERRTGAISALRGAGLPQSNVNHTR
jgi:hypothetical protein